MTILSGDIKPRLRDHATAAQVSCNGVMEKQPDCPFFSDLSSRYKIVLFRREHLHGYCFLGWFWFRER